MVHTSCQAMLCTNKYDILWWWKSFCVHSFCRTDIVLVNEVNYSDLYIWNIGLQILSKYIKRLVIKFHHPHSSDVALFMVFSNIMSYYNLLSDTSPGSSRAAFLSLIALSNFFLGPILRPSDFKSSSVRSIRACKSICSLTKQFTYSLSPADIRNNCRGDHCGGLPLASSSGRENMYN